MVKSDKSKEEKYLIVPKSKITDVIGIFVLIIIVLGFLWGVVSYENSVSVGMLVFFIVSMSIFLLIGVLLTLNNCIFVRFDNDGMDFLVGWIKYGRQNYSDIKSISVEFLPYSYGGRLGLYYSDYRPTVIFNTRCNDNKNDNIGTKLSADGFDTEIISDGLNMKYRDKMLTGASFLSCLLKSNRSDDDIVYGMVTTSKAVPIIKKRIAKHRPDLNLPELHDVSILHEFEKHFVDYKKKQISDYKKAKKQNKNR